METRLLAFPCSVSAPPWPLRNHNLSPPRNPNFSVHLPCRSARYRPRRSSDGSKSYWDSNAETLREGFRFELGGDSISEDDAEDEDDGIGFRRGDRQQRKWWSDEQSSWDSDEGSGVFEEAIDNVWILKVFSSFGWMLPAIILSMLLGTGPKAVLMALVLPLGQSAISLAIDKFWGRRRESPIPRSRTKKKPFARAPGDVRMNAEEKQEDKVGEAGNGRCGYQSWVTANDGSVKKRGQYRYSFGGWDELDRQGKPEMGPIRMPSRMTGGSPRPQVERKGKLSRRVRNKDTPLLIRLLIAFFPFLGSWTKIL
ncbi:PREDICTED: uncharacterized protein LOC104602101 [Nelumbo nucifera]|uniref:Uncharacterized protein LOC104602101 n=1 Tax=Nelumbo nucifera TaxID=4432 RepID=A0A1U8AEJ2_NELNU|nr:PREDICTED: uncharacterized protein LOC104602101 [Nelumbo nucifera]